MIDLATLKTEIEENTFNSKLLICKCKDITSKFIAEQYLHYYARANNFEIVEREDIEYSRNTWGAEESCVFIHKTDELTVKPTTEDNIWIITSKIKAKLAKELAEYIVEIPKLEEWQLKDYVATSCPRAACRRRRRAGCASPRRAAWRSFRRRRASGSPSTRRTRS